MKVGLKAELMNLIDIYVPTSDLNDLLKACVCEKEKEGSVWGELTYTLYRMLGGESEEEAVARAKVTELLILALDIMDDLQDLDNPDKPWMNCPGSYALNALLALVMMAMTVAASLPLAGGATPVGKVASLLLRSINGQQKDLNQSVVSEPTYVEMASEKSGSLMQLAFYMGYAGLPGMEGERLEQIEHLADCVGMAGQLRNDLSDVEHYDRKNDLLEKKRTLPVLFLLQHADEDFPPFKQFYEGALSREQFLELKPECLRFIADSGCVEYTQIIESLYLQRSEEMLDLIGGRSPWKEQFRKLTVGEPAGDEE